MRMNKSLFLLIMFSLCGTLSRAQDARDLLEKGDKLLFKKNFPEAVKYYEDAVKIAPTNADANYKLGLTYVNLNKKVKALAYLQKAIELNPEIDPAIHYELGLAYQANHQFDKAIEHYREFANKNKKMAQIASNKIAKCMIADSIMQHPAYATLENISAVNSTFHEYSPILFPDGNKMIFTSNRSTDDYKIKSGTNFEDIYTITRNSGVWSVPQKIGDAINIKYHDAAASLSPDGRTLFLYYEEGAGDIFTSTLNERNEWTKPVPLNRNINTPLFWETSASLSPNGKRLFFTSNRPGGRGELDIYVSELDDKGQWGKAVNLGPTINTTGNEDSPFLHPDGVTLYFSSDAHPGLGGNDIFKSEFKDGKWTKPVNLGYPVNSSDYDGFFSISNDKKSGYMSTLREGGLGEADIYFVQFHEPPKPVVKEELIASTAPAIVEIPSSPAPAPILEKAEEYVDPIIQMHKDLNVVTVLKGKVIDETSYTALGATVTLVDNESHKVMAKINSDPITGDFELIIPHGGNYGVATERKGYLFNSINFNVPQFADYQEVDMHIIMVKAEIGSKVVLKNVFFDVGKSQLKNESRSELEKIHELLAGNELLKVQINGHTDNTGNAATNKVLSLKRAESVVQYLVDKGVDAARLSAKGFGSERPLVSNDDESEGREINRRTEIEIIGNK